MVIFDRDEYFKRTLGDLDISRRVATIFIENGPEYIESIRHALAIEDAADLRQSAHKLRGSAATMALPQLAKTAKLFENLAATKEFEKATQLLPALLNDYEAALTALRESFAIEPVDSLKQGQK